MPKSDPMTDAELFTALHHALEELTALDTSTDRRLNSRRPFQCVQMLAPYDGITLPDQHAYTRSMFYDLSPTGFSYLADAPPETSLLVTALGRTPFRFFVAEIVHERRVEHEGRRRILVGCRFVSRVQPE
jgi:hypothetical protein